MAIDINQEAKCQFRGVVTYLVLHPRKLSSDRFLILLENYIKRFEDTALMPSYPEARKSRIFLNTNCISTTLLSITFFLHCLGALPIKLCMQYRNLHILPKLQESNRNKI
jgi:hypothetical protein